jgi:hypothetical protein
MESRDLFTALATSHNSLSLDQDLNPGHPEYETGATMAYL